MSTAVLSEQTGRSRQPTPPTATGLHLQLCVGHPFAVTADESRPPWRLCALQLFADDDASWLSEALSSLAGAAAVSGLLAECGAAFCQRLGVELTHVLLGGARSHQRTPVLGVPVSLPTRVAEERGVNRYRR